MCVIHLMTLTADNADNTHNDGVMHQVVVIMAP